MSAVEAIDVGALDEFREATPAVVDVAGREVVVVRWEGEVYALRNVCPHQSQSFVKGAVRREIGATPDGALHLKEPVLACPWHCWPFELATGRCTIDARKRVRTFEVSVLEGRVLIRP
jgi:nitrite reductase/ring-hydroxylating ferredoxin subunit